MMFTFAWPWLLVLLPLPLVIYYLLPAVQVRASTALRVPFFAAIQKMNVGYAAKISSAPLRRMLCFLIWACLVIAAAGPQLLGEPVSLERSGRNLLLAIDLSGSMQRLDMQLHGRKSNRLEVVKQVAEEFINRRVGDRLGLILFGSRAYLQTPLTFDRKTVLHMLHDATIGLAGQRTAIGDAIGLAVKRLQSAAEKSRVVILLTDGESNDGALSPIQAAKIAAKHNIKIYTIGIGANEMLVQGLFGPRKINPSADLDENTLKQVAKITGGLFFRATDIDGLRKVYASIDQLEPVKSGTSVWRPVTHFYQWPLGLALLLSLLLLVRFIRYSGVRANA